MLQKMHHWLAEETHDEAAFSLFSADLRAIAIFHAKSGSRLLYEKQIKPDIDEVEQENYREILKLILAEPYGKYASSLRLLAQEIAWDGISSTVYRQLPSIVDAANLGRCSGGSLLLDPSVKVPRYVSAVDIHAMPGGYANEMDETDISVGAIYDRGVFIRSLGSIGSLNEDFGLSGASWIKQQYSALRPRRVLDMGCSVGHSTLPYKTIFPEAEISAIDISAPLLRYAHGRAEALGVPISFSQRNAETTNFPDGHFDIVVSHALLHETSNAVIRKILSEARRLLAPGGITLHFEGPPWARIDPFDAAVHHWDTHYNSEPFIGRMHDLDPEQLIREAGYDKAGYEYIDVNVPSVLAEIIGPWKGTTGSGEASYWFFGARRKC